MKINGASDLARLQMLQKQAFDVRDRLNTAATELTTGEKASRFEATGGNLTRLFALERALDRNAVFSETISLTELRLDVMQESLGRILAPAEDLAINLANSVEPRRRLAPRCCTRRRARRDFAATVGILNTQVAGQSIFAGTATDGAGAGAGRRDPRRPRRAGRRRRQRRGRDRRDRGLLRRARGRLLRHRLYRLARRSDPGRDRRGAAHGLRPARRRRRARGRAAGAGDGRGGGRRRLRRRPGRAAGAARRGGRRRCSPPRRASSTCARRVGVVAGGGRARPGRAGLGARHARARPRQDRGGRPAARRPRPTRRCRCSSRSVYTVTARLANLRFSNFLR